MPGLKLAEALLHIENRRWNEAWTVRLRVPNVGFDDVKEFLGSQRLPSERRSRRMRLGRLGSWRLSGGLRRMLRRGLVLSSRRKKRRKRV